MKDYSIDFRKAALQLKKNGKTYREITELLGVSRNTVYLWSKRESLEPTKKTGRRRIKTGVENWSDFVKEHAGQTLVEMSQLLPISKTTLHTRLVQAGLSYKKNNNVYRSRPTKAKKVLPTD